MASDSLKPEITVSNRRLSVIAWTTAAMLLGFLCLRQYSGQLPFSLGRGGTVVNMGAYGGTMEASRTTVE